MEGNTVESDSTALTHPSPSPAKASPPSRHRLVRFQGEDADAPFSLFPPESDVRFSEFDGLAPEWESTFTLPEGAMSTMEIPGITPLPEVEANPATYADFASEQWRGVISDHTEFYSVEGLTWLAVGFGAGAAMANSSFDENVVRHKYIENVVNISEDEFYEAIHQPHFLGDGRYTIPVFAIAALSGPLIDELPFGEVTSDWGQRSLRTILVGGPPMLAAQFLTGASRPGETSHSSHWKPFQDDNGVSGHSFMGAIPFMSAAKITDKPWLKAGLYVLSAAPAVSRVNDDKHYFSQAFLGWWMAYIAATAVDRSCNPDSNVRWFATPVGDGLGIGMMYQR